MTKDEKLIVVDTETTNSIDDPICYDVGFAVIDSEGTVYEKHSFVVADIFLDAELMDSAFFKDKIPQYWDEIKQGKRLLRRFSTIRRVFAEVVRKYDVKIICAHNARFDYRSLNLTQRFLTSSKFRYFFPYGCEIWDTLKMARATLKRSEEYEKFCYENEFLTARLQRRFSAEVLYRFITQDPSFEEAHTGLEDVLIEKEIFTYCVKQNPEICGKLWED